MIPRTPHTSAPDGTPRWRKSLTAGLRGFFTGAGLPLFVLAATLVYEAFLFAVVFAPESTGAWGGFAREFKLWCFDYDPRTGGMEWAAVGVMLVEPPFIAAITAFLWRASLRITGGPRALFACWRPVLAGGFAGTCAMAGLFAYGQPGNDAAAALPFPGERIRTQLAPPAFRFSDQDGREFGLEEARGRVVLITGIYAMCGDTCPEILRETRALVESLPAADRAQLSVVALSLNPEYDSALLRGQIAAAYGLPYPDFRYLNGPPAAMHDTLTRLGFARTRNPRTGTIDHANLFLLVDAGGSIAYRLTLDERHQTWLRAAVLALTGEAQSRPAELARAP